MSNPLDSYLANKTQILDDLFQFLQIPSVSRDKQAVHRAATWLVDRLNLSSDVVQMVDTPGNPVILGEWYSQKKLNNDSKTLTLLIYGHYDVQPPEPLGSWISPPFEPEIRNERIYARGVADNKGQFFTHLVAIEDTHKRKQLGINVKFLFDGEEEIGSPNLQRVINQEREFFKDVDLTIVSDGPADPSWSPTLCFGARGIVTVQLELVSANQDVHSGNFGGIQPSPAIDLSHLISKLIDEEGKCLIPGFYEEVFIPDQLTIDAADELDRSPEMYKKYLGITYFGGEQNIPLIQRVMFRPTFNVRGYHSGNVREHAKTIIPKEAVLEIDMRLVPYQKPERIRKLFLKYLNQIKRSSERWHGILDRCKVTFEADFAPLFTPLNLPWTNILKKSIYEGSGKEAVLVPLLGGSLPLYNLYKEIGKPMYLLPFGQPDQGNHAPNENLHVDWFDNGVKTSLMLLKNLKSI
ncbi:MAG: M20/M25/M40 family metallo-hydrolase [Candidatus Hodarchaeales archaeon]